MLLQNELQLNIRRRAPANAEHWDQMWRSCPHATFYHSSQWHEIWRRYSGGCYHPEPLLVSFTDSRTALLVLGSMRGRGGLVWERLSSPATTFGGWISSDPLTEAHAALLAAEMRGQSSLIWRVNPFDLFVGVLPREGMREETTHALRLAGSFEEIYRRSAKNHRGANRQGRSKGVTVTVAASLEDWKSYYEIYLDSLHRWGEKATSNHEWSLFEQIYLLRSPHVKLWLARLEGKAISGALVFYSYKIAAYWNGASLESHMTYRPAQVLLYEAICHAAESGLEWFDFGPSGPHEGVRRFKAGFGCMELPSPVLTTAPSVASKALVRLKEMLGR